jgi:AcrR family transcriptional regulator
MEETRVPRLTAKGQATRERIVAAAAGLMVSGGVMATTIDDVQSAAGVSASQLYHYFGDKRALVAAVIVHQTEAVVGGQEPLFAALDTLEALRQWGDLIVELQRSRNCAGGCPLATLAGELAESDEAARAGLRVAFARWAAGIAGGLRRMQDRGELPGGADPDRLAVAVLAALQGGLLLAQVERATEPLEIALDTVIDHIASLSAGARRSSR